MGGRGRERVREREVSRYGGERKRERDRESDVARGEREKDREISRWRIWV